MTRSCRSSARRGVMAGSGSELFGKWKLAAAFWDCLRVGFSGCGAVPAETDELP